MLITKFTDWKNRNIIKTAGSNVVHLNTSGAVKKLYSLYFLFSFLFCVEIIFREVFFSRTTRISTFLSRLLKKQLNETVRLLLNGRIQNRNKVKKKKKTTISNLTSDGIVLLF